MVMVTTGRGLGSQLCWQQQREEEEEEEEECRRTRQLVVTAPAAR